MQVDRKSKGKAKGWFDSWLTDEVILTVNTDGKAVSKSFKSKISQNENSLVFFEAGKEGELIADYVKQKDANPIKTFVE